MVFIDDPGDNGFLVGFCPECGNSYQKQTLEHNDHVCPQPGADEEESD